MCSFRDDFPGARSSRLLGSASRTDPGVSFSHEYSGHHFASCDDQYSRGRPIRSRDKVCGPYVLAYVAAILLPQSRIFGVLLAIGPGTRLHLCQHLGLGHDYIRCPPVYGGPHWLGRLSASSMSLTR
jgi:hypothetical protein